MNEAYSAYPHESLTTMQHHTDKCSIRPEEHSFHSHSTATINV